MAWFTYQDSSLYYLDINPQAALLHGLTNNGRAWAPHYDLREALPALAVPSQVLSSSEDRSSPPAEGCWIAERIGTARHTVLPGAGHVFKVPLARAFNQALPGFLDEASTDAR